MGKIWDSFAVILGREVGCWQLDRYSSNQFDKERDNKCYNSSSL